MPKPAPPRRRGAGCREKADEGEALSWITAFPLTAPEFFRLFTSMAATRTPRTQRQVALGLVLAPYFLILLASLHAPALPLPLPTWGRKGSLPLGRELSPSLRTLSPHVWPHPIWSVPILMLIALAPLCATFFIGFELAFGVPLLLREQHAYLDRLKELPEHGFVAPSFGIVHGWRTLLYSLYLELWAKPDVRDFAPLRSDSRLERLCTGFLPATLPPRAGGRPAVPPGLPQRQLDQLAAIDVQVWPQLVKDPRGQLAHLAAPTAAGATDVSRVRLSSTFGDSPLVEVALSPNEGAGAKGLLCLECHCRRREVQRMQCEVAHEHSADCSWHAILCAADARRVCELGWAERGPPIACKSAFQPHFDFAPEGWVFLYAPRNADEAHVLRIIVEAAYRFGSTSEQEPSPPAPAADKAKEPAPSPALQGSKRSTTPRLSVR